MLVRFTSRFTSLSSQLHISPQVVAFCFVLSIACGVVIGLVPAIGVRQTPSLDQSWATPISRAGSVAHPRNSGGRATGALGDPAGRRRADAAHPPPTGTRRRRIRRQRSLHRANLRAERQATRTSSTSCWSAHDGFRECKSVALSSTFPLYDRGSDNDHSGRNSRRASHPIAPRSRVRIVTPDYFRTLGFVPISGRDFTEPDDGKTPPPSSSSTSTWQTTTGRTRVR